MPIVRAQHAEPPTVHYACSSHLISGDQPAFKPQNFMACPCLPGRHLNSYPDASNKDDEISIISRSIPFVADEANNTFAQAVPLTSANSPFQGVIGFNGDVDVFSLQGSTGDQKRITFMLVNDFQAGNSSYLQRSNLNAEVTLHGPSGPIQTWAQVSGGLLSGVLIPSQPLPSQVTVAPEGRCVARKALNSSNQASRVQRMPYQIPRTSRRNSCT